MHITSAYLKSLAERLERRADESHGMHNDKQLMREAAKVFRAALGEDDLHPQQGLAPATQTLESLADPSADVKEEDDAEGDHDADEPAAEAAPEPAAAPVTPAAPAGRKPSRKG